MELEWCDDYSVGVASLDEQHKQLVVFTDELFQAIMKEASEEVIRGVVNKLVEYVEYHFDHEEKLLSKHGYDPGELNQHIRSHKQLTNQVHGFVKRLDAGELALDLKLYQFLRKWMEDHLVGIDKNYAKFLQNCGAV